jgi:hypothetical protein
MGSEVRTPWPISDLPHHIFTTLLEEISSHAFGEKDEAGLLGARDLPGKWNAKTKLKPAVPEDFRKLRRVAFEDNGEAPNKSDAQYRQA